MIKKILFRLLNFKISKIFSLIVLFFWFSTTSVAQYMQFHLLPNTVEAYTWVGRGSDSNWNNPENWSTYVVPGVSDIAIFNNSCSGAQCNVTLNIPVSVRGILMASSYTGTITQSTFAVTIGSGGWTMNGGTFVGGSGAINFGNQATFTLSGGSFTATSGTMMIESSVYFNLATASFFHNNGTVNLSFSTSSDRDASLEGAIFHRLIFSNQGRNYARNLLGTSFTVQDTVTCHATAFFMSVNNGTIIARRDVIFNEFGCRGNAVIQIAGNVSQQIVSNSTDVEAPSFTIQSTGGTVSFANTFIVRGDFVNISGVVDLSASTLRFHTPSYGDRTMSLGTGLVFNNVAFIGTSTNDGSNRNISGDFIIAGTLSCESPTTPVSLNGTNMYIRGNVNLINSGCVGTITKIIDGTGNQNFSGVLSAFFGHTVINKPSGTLNLSGEISFRLSFTYTSGSVNAGTSNVRFFGTANTTQTIASTSALAFYNLTFFGDGNSITRNISGELLSTNLFTCDYNVSAGSLNSGRIIALGSLNFVNQGCQGTVQIDVTGSGTQTLSGVITARIPSLRIAASGTVNFSGSPNFFRDFEYSTGSINAGTSTVYISNLSNTTFSVILAAGIEFNNFQITGNATFSARNITGEIITNGTFGCDTSGQPRIITGGTVTARGNVSFVNTGCSGNLVVSMVGSSSASLNKWSGASIPNTLFTINKSSGATVTMSATFFTNTGQSFLLQSGNLNLNGFGLTNVDVLTVSSGTSITCNGGDLTYNTLVNNGTINCPGFAIYPFHWTGAGGNSNWNTAANWSGGVVPGAADTAAFSDAFCGANCNATMNVNPNVRGVRILSDYTGTISQGTGVAMTIGAMGWVQRGGTFLGSNANQTINAFLYVFGGSFRATSATLLCSICMVDFSSSATFVHNNGLVDLNNGSGRPIMTYDFDDEALNNLTIQGSATQILPTPITVLGNFIYNANQSNSSFVGEIRLHGNYTVLNLEDPRRGIIRFVGTNNQSVITTGAINDFTTRVGRVIFDKPSGTVTFTGHHVIGGFQYIQAGGVIFQPGAITWVRNQDLGSCSNLDTYTPGPIQFQNVVIYECGPRSINGTMQVLGNLEINMASSSPSLRNGKIQVHGNFNLINEWNSVDSSTEIEMVGNTNSTVTVAATRIFPGNFTISKTGGAAVNLLSSIVVRNNDSDLRINSGILNMGGFNVTIGAATGTNNILILESGTVINRGGGTLTYEGLTNNGGTINP